jgi:hypothetical protein
MGFGSTRNEANRALDILRKLENVDRLFILLPIVAYRQRLRDELRNEVVSSQE